MHTPPFIVFQLNILIWHHNYLFTQLISSHSIELNGLDEEQKRLITLKKRSINAATGTALTPNVYVEYTSRLGSVRGKGDFH